MAFKIFLLSALVAVTMASEVSQVSQANNLFTNRIYQELAKKDGNVFFSPLSIHTVLSMVGQGAAGETAQKISQALNVDFKTAAAGYQGIMQTLNNVPNVTLNLANKIYVMDKYTVKPNFKSIATGQYLSDAESINFADNANAANKINGWCAEKTNNKISKLVEPSDLDSLTRMVLLNAIYFKGNWAQKFNPESTTKKPFYVNDKETIDVDMMYVSKKFHYGFNKDLEAQILELKYENRDVSMVIVLPNDKNGIKALEQKLATFDLGTLTNGLFETTVDVYLPKFKLETEMDLKPVLSAMGLEVMFGGSADFSELLESPEPLYVSKAIQKAFIEVNEEGSEAAAVTVAITKWRTARRPFFFTADHPFLITIVKKTSSTPVTLFLGKILKPSY